MNLDDMLEKALQKIESMSMEEFEQECIKAGYKPVRKPDCSMPESRSIDKSLVGPSTYSKTVSIDSKDLDGFATTSSDEYNFSLAA